MLTAIDGYLQSGCGRCDLYDTPDCKVHTWRDLLLLLRPIVLDCGLTEAYKWSQPCYTLNGKNVLILTAFRDYCALAFFKGSLLNDEAGLLITPGQNSQAGRQLRFTRADQIVGHEATIKDYIFQAIEVEKAGLKVAFKQNPEPVPGELQAMFDADPTFQAAFDALTPGRQRGYILHFSQPKQSKTRTARIEKYLPQIMAGKGIHDDYRARRKASR